MEHLPARSGEARERQLHRGGSNSRRASSGNLREDILEISHLPTPTTRDYKDGTAEHKRDGVVQTDTVARAVFNSGEIVLPTPTTNGNDRKGPNYSSAGILQELEIANGILPKEYKDWNHAKQKVKWAEPIEGQEKTRLDSETSWGKFEPAIRRWEQVLGRPAPEPTKPDGKDGNHRLSSAFTEWMMGLEPGWITDCGLTRNDELKAAGNGVVPQQAELALRILLGLDIPKALERERES
jgi:DNA (cytosine-5)-methyltransferase 1